MSTERQLFNMLLARMETEEECWDCGRTQGFPHQLECAGAIACGLPRQRWDYSPLASVPCGPQTEPPVPTWEEAMIENFNVTIRRQLERDLYGRHA